MKRFIYFTALLFFIISGVLAQEIKTDTSIFFTGLNYILNGNNGPVELNGIVVISKKKIFNGEARVMSTEEIIRSPKEGHFSIVARKVGFENEIMYALYENIFDPRLVPAGEYFIIFYYKDFVYKQLVTVLDFPPIKTIKNKRPKRRLH